MKRKYILPVLLYSVIVVTCIHAQNSSLVFPGADGKLEYALYANQGQSNAVNKIPDFSFAGYQGGGVALPYVEVKETIEPSSGDAGAMIQSAIDRVSLLPLDASGFRGAILFKSGTYEVSGSLYIRASGVVLRGEGQNTPDKGGTELVAASRMQHDFIQLERNESTAEPTLETILDTSLYPRVDTLQSFNVLKGVAEELEGDKIISFHMTTNVNQYVNYGSREDSLHKQPFLEVLVKSASTGADSVLILLPVEDAYVRGGIYADMNFGDDTSLPVKNAGTNKDVTREAYLKFDLTAVRDSVKSAFLKIYTKKDLAGDPAALKIVNVSVAAISDDSWQEMTITYATRPLSGGGAGGSRITTAYVPTGAISFEIQDASGLAIGDTIRVTRTPNEAWITALDMAQYGWTASEYWISYERVITAIEGNTVTVNIPLVQAIQTEFGGGEIVRVTVKGRLKNCAVENMLISSYYASSTDESHGWSAVTLYQTEHCWVRNVTARYFGYSCVGLYRAYNTTVEECAMLDPKSITTGSRKYSFYIDKGSFNLFHRCYTRGGRHDFVTGSRVAGPNVFVDCYAKETYADIGPHHRYATGVLFDNIRGGETRVQNRKDMGSGHGWAGAQTLFWNCKSVAGEFKVESPEGAMNWGIGCAGLVKNGAGFWESWGMQVLPRSLYYEQLNDRLGPQAVENVTLLEQRLGTIWNQLSSWAGIGELSTGTFVHPDHANMPSAFSLEQNYPNPFNPATTIRYGLKNSGRVRLDIFNALGQNIATLVEKEQSAGRYEISWDARNSSGSPVPSGIYFCRLETSSFTRTVKMILMN